jgi:translation initiation factor IF-3|tara:strand:- start:2027 stop:2563 length:537 start_codon:yes stop_codon:yes gene_type:complete
MNRLVFKQEATPLINGFIRQHKLRLIDENGQQHGIVNKHQALQLAESADLDLVLINEKADPPIAKLLDAGKYFYEQKRKEKELQKRQRETATIIKEMQFKLGIGDHDFNTKLRHIEKFLGKDCKVKCVIKYRGRENANKQLGFEIMKRIIENIAATEWDIAPSLNGNRLIGVLKMRKE